MGKAGSPLLMRALSNTTLGAALTQGLLGSYVLSVDGLLRKKNPRMMV